MPGKLIDTHIHIQTLGTIQSHFHTRTHTHTHKHPVLLSPHSPMPSTFTHAVKHSIPLQRKYVKGEEKGKIKVYYFVPRVSFLPVSIERKHGMNQYMYQYVRRGVTL